MRFRNRLSIMLVILAVVPLAAASLLASSLVRRDETTQVDGNLQAGVSGAFGTYQGQLYKTRTKAATFASSKPVQRALAGRGDPQAAAASIAPPWTAQLERRGKVIGGKAPAGPAWKAEVPVGAHSAVVVWLPITDSLLVTLSRGYPQTPGVELAAVAGGRAFASTSGITGPVTGLTSSSVGNASVGGHDVRAQAVTLPTSKGGPVLLASTYPSAAIDNAVDSRLLRLLAPLIVAALIVTALALFAAGRISQALTDLSGRAVSLLRPGTPPPAGDELDELGAVIDHMSTELTTRVDELEAERGRVKETLQRYGETLAATHRLDALVAAVLDTAVQATRARGGRLMLYDGDTGQATEQARIGSALGSRTDLPMVVSAGAGLEGLALAEMAPRSADQPRAVLTAPIVREDTLLGLVTVVDPEGGRFARGDFETLAGLAVQAGVAIENARLHAVVEQQAVTDALTGLANRRQFYEVLGREFERAQRFGHELGLIMLDIDDFKQVNDTLGHLAGDVVLHEVAAALQDMIREIDVAARYGGEEFAVLLPQTGREGAASLAERLRIAIAERDIVFAGAPIEGITASFGVSAGPEDGMGQLDLVASADAALYRAKRQGKNDVVVV
ncbi:MAG TPA: sensor domain-containing diguanylate cyclase [Gaiellales bacterium]|nr:sensor domain-containing diguanylate cyclase [Gaiellales bacterium]